MAEDSEMKWNEQTSLELIELYKNHRVLWDLKNPNHYNKNAKNEAWESIATEMGTPEIECRRKMVGLLSSLRRERAKIRRRIITGEDKISDPSWFAYKSFNFLPKQMKLISALSNASVDGSPEEIDAGNSSQYVEEDQNKITSKSTPQKNIKIAEGTKLGKTYKVYASLPASSADNECRSFGTYIIHKLQKYTPETRSAVENAISNIIFLADKGNFGKNYFPQSFPHYLFDAHQDAEMTDSGERGCEMTSDSPESLPKTSSAETPKKVPNLPADSDLDDRNNVVFNVQ